MLFDKKVERFYILYTHTHTTSTQSIETVATFLLRHEDIRIYPVSRPIQREQPMIGCIHRRYRFRDLYMYKSAWELGLLFLRLCSYRGMRGYSRLSWVAFESPGGGGGRDIIFYHGQHRRCGG